MGMTLFENEKTMWGGSPLNGLCLLSELKELVAFINQEQGAVYIHDSNCAINTAESYVGSVQIGWRQDGASQHWPAPAWGRRWGFFVCVLWLLEAF